MRNQYMFDILDREDVVQDHRNIYAGSESVAWARVEELRTEGDTWRLVETVPGKRDEQCNIVEFTGFTRQGDEMTEWCDDETSQHAVTLDRQARGWPDIDFYFETQAEAHALFLALCDAKSIQVVVGEEVTES